MEEVKKQVLPAVAVRSACPIPNNNFRFEIGREISLNALDECENNFNQKIILLIQKDPKIEEIKPDNIYEYGVLAQLVLKLKLPNDIYRVKFKIIKRVHVLSYIQTEPHLLVDYEDYESYCSGSLDEEMTVTRMVIDRVSENANQVLEKGDEVMRLIQSNPLSDYVCDVVSFNLKTTQDKYRYIAEADTMKRLTFILEDLTKEKTIQDIEARINNIVKENSEKAQKEWYLREKMKAIQEELGDTVKTEEEIEKLRNKIKEAKMPTDIEEKLLKELQKYQNTPTQALESSLIRNYLDFMLELPWSEATTDIDDIKKVSEQLNKDHYGLENVKDRIIEYLSVKIANQKNPQTILCLYGPPGTGKTSVARSIATSLGRKFVKASLGGLSDEAEIRGHRRTYVGAMPGRILNAMKESGVTNPVFLLDEIDKLGKDYKGDPASAMLEVLDPEQNKFFSDNYAEVPYDLSQVLFITTANYIENIPAPLRDRMELIELNSYTEHEKYHICRDYLIPKQLELHGVKEDDIEITDDVIYRIIRNNTAEAGVRELSRYMGQLVRKSIKDRLLNGIKKVIINDEKLTEYIKIDKYMGSKCRESDEVGIVTGLAYTQFGGDTLDIEVTTYKGKGNIQLTGKLGDVMKESAQIALSLVKTNATKFGIKEEIFNEVDIHLHVPEGATPKDGPSAGVTMTMALISALSGQKARANLGMTGEVSLRGFVMPIGGLREKSIAAHRNGLKKILIPFENQKDIIEIPEEVKKELEIIPIKTIDEAYNLTIIKE